MSKFQKKELASCKKSELVSIALTKPLNVSIVQFKWKLPYEKIAFMVIETLSPISAALAKLLKSFFHQANKQQLLEFGDWHSSSCFSPINFSWDQTALPGRPSERKPAGEKKAKLSENTKQTRCGQTAFTKALQKLQQQSELWPWTMRVFSPLLIFVTVATRPWECLAKGAFRCNDQNPNWKTRPEASPKQPFSEFCPNGKLVLQKVPDDNDVSFVFMLATMSAIPNVDLNKSKGMVNIGSREKADISEDGILDITELSMPEVAFCGNADIVAAITSGSPSELIDFEYMSVKIPCQESADQDYVLRVTPDLSKVPQNKIAPGTVNVFEALGLTEVAIFPQENGDLPSVTSWSKPSVSVFLYNDEKLSKMWSQYKDNNQVWITLQNRKHFLIIRHSRLCNKKQFFYRSNNCIHVP